MQLSEELRGGPGRHSDPVLLFGPRSRRTNRRRKLAAMGRLPFDPDRMAGPSKPKASTGGDAPLRVSQLAAMIDRALRDHTPAKIRVIGEISGFRDRTHWYFDIKDEDSVVSCVMFASAARRTGFEPASGQEVVVTGRVEFYAKQGRTTFLVEKLEPVGAGAMELAFRALCEELRAKGWFDPKTKTTLPAFPRRVAVVTSRTGAALQDVLDTMRRRCAAVDVSIVDVRVQGQEAAGEIARAIKWLSKNGKVLGVDAILLTRGGGSMEDLWAFNERIVGEAIHGCTLPIVAAIGHETDTTIAELVADERAATPTQAAMRLTPDRLALGEQLDALGRRLSADIRKTIELDTQRVRGVARHALFSDPAALIKRGREQVRSSQRHMNSATADRLREQSGRLARLSVRLERRRPAALHAGRVEMLGQVGRRLDAAIRQRLRRVDLARAQTELARTMARNAQQRRLRLDGLGNELEAVGPVGVLRRGFSCTLAEDGSLVRSVDDVAAGQALRTRVVDGAFGSVVSGAGGVQDAQKPVVDKPKRRKMARRQKTDSRDQMDLFGSSG